MLKQANERQTVVQATSSRRHRTAWQHNDVLSARGLKSYMQMPIIMQSLNQGDVTTEVT